MFRGFSLLKGGNYMSEQTIVDYDALAALCIAEIEKAKATPRSKYDKITLSLPKGSKDFLKTQAAIRGKKSVTELVTDAIESYCDVTLKKTDRE
jgi:hypothetical protein